MRWDTIKNKCVTQASNDLSTNESADKWGKLLTQLIKEGNAMTFYDAQRKAKEKCYKIIDSWDIRQWQSLRNIFPNVFPNQLNQPKLADRGWELL